MEPRVTWLRSGEKSKEVLGEESIDSLPGLEAALELHGSGRELPYVDEYMQQVIMDDSILLETRILIPDGVEWELGLKWDTPYQEEALKLSLRLQDAEEDGVTVHEVIIRFEPNAPGKATPVRERP